MKKLIFKSSFVALSFFLLLLTSCARTSTNLREQNINPISNYTESDVLALGLWQVKILGPVFFEKQQKCSKVDFMQYAQLRFADKQDVINLIMQESKVSTGSGNSVEVSYSCKYYGTAITYKELNLEEAKEWGKLKWSVKTDSAANQTSNANSNSPTYLTPLTESNSQQQQ